MEGGIRTASEVVIMSYVLICLVFNQAHSHCENSYLSFGYFSEYMVYCNKQVFLVAVHDLVKAEYPNLQFMPNQIYCCHLFVPNNFILSFFLLLAQGSQASLHDCPQFISDLYWSPWFYVLFRYAC